MTRMMIDCRTMPSESNCSLRIEGTEEEVVRAAVQHDVEAHGHEDTPELREQVRAALQEVTDAPSDVGAFIQLIEFRAGKEQLAEGKALMDSYDAEIGSARTARWAIMGADRDHPDTYVQIVEFPSYEQAMVNSEHPATRALSEALQKLAEGKPTFRNLDVEYTQTT
ncbi:MAG TPA: DUF1059 domain-containing protein [Streptosporangiales bacterium]